MGKLKVRAEDRQLLKPNYFGIVESVDGVLRPQPQAGLDDLAMVPRCEAAPDGDNLPVLDQDVGECRFVDIAVVVIDFAAADEQPFWFHRYAPTCISIGLP